MFTDILNNNIVSITKIVYTYSIYIGNNSVAEIKTITYILLAGWVIEVSNSISSVTESTYIKNGSDR